MERLKTFMEVTRAVNEGAGAGYTIEGIVKNIRLGQNTQFKKISEDVFLIEGDITGNVEITKAHSYEYSGSAEGYDAECKIPALKIQVYDMRHGLKEEISEDLENSEYKFSYLYGGGWSHVMFDGYISLDDVDTNDYSNVLILDGKLQIDDNKLCTFIDNVVTGKNITTEYNICRNGESMEDLQFTTKEEAIDYLNKNMEHDENNYDVTILTFSTGIDGNENLIGSETVYKF